MFAPRVTPLFATSYFFLINGLCHGTLMARMPALKAQVNVNDQLLGQALLALGLGALAAFPFTGFLVKRYGSALITSSMCLALLLVVSIPTAATNWWLFAGSMFVVGVFSGSLNVAMNAQAIAVEQHTKKPVMSRMHGMYSLGGVVGALSAALLSDLSVLINVLGVSVLGLLILPWCASRLLPDKFAIKAKVRRSSSFLPPKSLRGLCLLALCAFLCEGAIADWSALLLHDSKGASQSLAALGFGAFAAFMLLGRLLGDHIRGRYDEQLLVRCLSVVAFTGVLISVLADNPWLCIFGFGLAGCGFSILVPIIISSAGKQEDIDSSVAVVAVSTFGYGGLLLGPPFIGFLANALTLQVAMLLLVILTFVIFCGAGFVKSRANGGGALESV